MSKNRANLGYLGHSFQIQLINQIIVDEKFATTIVDILDPTYFDSEYLRLIFAEIKNYYEKYQTIPLVGTIEQIVNQKISKEITKELTKKIVYLYKIRQ
jgi:replicative DNA helicase